MQSKQFQAVSLAVLAIIVSIFVLFAIGNRRQQLTDSGSETVISDKGDFKSGVITSISNKILSIQTDDNITYWFSTDRQTSFGYENENLGDTVSIEYEGEYTDFILAKSISLTKKVNEDNTTVPEAISAALNENAKIYLTAGTVTDITKNYITLVTDHENDEIITVNKTEATITDDIISIGDSARVYYVDSSGSNPRALNVKVISPKTESFIKRSAKNNTVHYATGKVITSEDKTIMIANGKYNYRIVKSDNIISDNIKTGDAVRVYLSGTFIDGLTASYIEIIG